MGSEPAAWHPDLRDYARDAGDRQRDDPLRFCTLDGQMDFKVKGEVTKAPRACALVRGARWKSADTTLVFRPLVGVRVTGRAPVAGAGSGLPVGRELSAVRLETGGVPGGLPWLSHGKVKPS